MASESDNLQSIHQSGNSAGPTAGDLLITNARLIDGTVALPTPPTSILVEKGKISAIGDINPVEGLRTIDADGATVMPGLIDAHVHLQSVPGSAYRGDGEELLSTLHYHHLRAYLACGVTSVLDAGISPEMLGEFQSYLKAGGPGPRIFALAPAFYPPDGYQDHGLLTPQWGPHWKPAGSREDVQALFRDYEHLENVVGVKVLLEPGFGPRPIWPLHTPEMRKIIIEESAKRDLPIHTHAYGEKEQAISFEMGVHNLAHAGFLQSQPTDEFIQTLLDNRVYLTTTLASTLEQYLVQFDLKRLDDPYLQDLVPEIELETARDLEAWAKTNYIMIRTSSPKWMPNFLVRFLAKKVNMEKEVRKCVESSSKAINAMYKAGVPIAMGTDTANWPIFLNFFHGTSTIHETGLLGRAGMAPLDVLSSATRIPAEMMRVEDKIGTVAPGKLADLIIVDGNPAEDLASLRNILWTIKEGDARTPAQWLQSA